MKQKAFTLIELLVVISIISLLASVVLASLNTARDKGRMAAGKQFEANVYHAEADQAVGVWDFDECSGTIASDRSGNGNDGTLVGSPVWSSDTPNGRGCSLQFTGANYMTVAQGIAVTSKFTLATWFKTSNGQQSTYRSIFSKQLTAATNRNYWFGLSGNAGYCGYGSLLLLWSVAGVADVGRGCTPNRYDDNVWHFGVAVYDGTTIKMYVDGTLQSSTTATVPDQQTAATVIGIYSDLAAIPFLGEIDSPRIFTKDLTASEVGKFYADSLSTHRLADNVK